MGSQELLPHLFRTEYRKIVSVLCRHFGFAQIEIAEDIASDTFAAAAQTWPINGLPPNPTAWLYRVAKNKAHNALQRNNLFDSRITAELKSLNNDLYEAEIDLSPQNIIDSQLQMMFAVCHPSIPAEAQAGLALRILCGFGIDEIADAFLSNKETINKRLYRAKEKLRQQNIQIALPSASGINSRLDTVLLTIYLLFNEGYYSVSGREVINKDICFEAIRLCSMLAANPLTNRPQVNALLALMYFHASRLDARLDENGAHILYDDQDTGLWDDDLICKGVYYLHCAATGDELSKYHIEATIAYWRTQKMDSLQKWETVLRLYDNLLRIAYSPMAALNSAYVLSKTAGIDSAIEAAEKLALENNLFYHVLLGELYTGPDNHKALLHFNIAASLAKTDTDKTAISIKTKNLQERIAGTFVAK